MAWAGWGAGPSGAGAAGPSRVFLVVAFVSAGVAAGTLFIDGKWPEGGLAALAAVYFAARLLGFGRKRA
jgi:hypothetical protein